MTGEGGLRIANLQASNLVFLIGSDTGCTARRVLTTKGYARDSCGRDAYRDVKEREANYCRWGLKRRKSDPFNNYGMIHLFLLKPLI